MQKSESGSLLTRNWNNYRIYLVLVWEELLNLHNPPKMGFLFLVQKVWRFKINGGGGEVEATNGVHATFCLFQILLFKMESATIKKSLLFSKTESTSKTESNIIFCMIAENFPPWANTSVTKITVSELFLFLFRYCWYIWQSWR